MTWLKKNEMEVHLNTQLKVSQYREILTRLQALWTHPLADTIKQSYLINFIRLGGVKERQLNNKIKIVRLS